VRHSVRQEDEKPVNEKEEKRVLNFLHLGSKTGLELILSASDVNKPFFEKLKSAAEQIEAACKGAVRIVEDDALELVGKPGLTLSCRGKKNIHYLARPEGFEAPPFFKTLIELIKSERVGDRGFAADLAEVKDGAELLVFIAPTCPHCPEMVSRAIRLALDCDSVSVSVIDIEEFPELTQRFKIKSVPFTVLDGGMSWTGLVDLREIVEQIVSRGSAKQGMAAFRAEVESGRLEKAVETILAKGGADFFAGVWEKSVTSLRLGLMLAAEDALDSDSASLDPAVPKLISLLFAEDAALRGDTADLLGRIGDPRAMEKLEALLDDPNPDVAEIAQEALDEIRERGR
jgi:thiol-disulfide isomerase/thioredoxin